MSDYHEPTEELAAHDRDLHRALVSLKEEIEAVDWYHQRVVCATDPSLKELLEHNRDEEIEHASMTLEWLRRRMPAWNEHLSTYLFREAEVTEIEAGAHPGDAVESPTAETSEASGLGIGGLRPREDAR